MTDDKLRAILTGYSWIRVPKHLVPDGTTPEDAYRLLDEHHVAETTFLIKGVRTLAAELLLLRRTTAPVPDEIARAMEFAGLGPSFLRDFVAWYLKSERRRDEAWDLARADVGAQGHAYRKMHTANYWAWYAVPSVGWKPGYRPGRRDDDDAA